MTQTIEQLTARVRELEDTLAQVNNDRFSDAQVFTNSVSEHRKQLAASQLQVKNLREALATIQWRIGNKEYAHAAMLVSEALALPRDTSALDASVAEKVKEATELSESISNMHMLSLEKISTLTRQRDLAVEALLRCGRAESKDECGLIIDEALSTIKESEGK